MFEKLKQYFLKQEVEASKPIIITIHGYGRRRQHEFDNLALWGASEQMDIVQFDMYDLFDETDCSWKDWLQRAKDAIKPYIGERDIYLVGFSMGGVIASYLAATLPIKRLVLMAPAFNYINLDVVGGVISKTAATLLGNEEKDEIKLPTGFYTAFTSIVKNLKKYVNDIECPVLFLHGDQDEVISLKSSIWGYERIHHTKKKMIILHEGHHRLLMDETVNWQCFQLIRLFFQGELLKEDPIPQAPDIMEELIRQKHALQEVSLQDLPEQDIVQQEG